GCCGLAGSFGFEADHYDVSMAVGERALLPAVRDQGGDTLVVTDGFSCREQIRMGTDRVPLHTAQVMQMALHERKGKGKSVQPQRREPALAGGGSPLLGALALGGAAVLAGAAARGVGHLFEHSTNGQRHEKQTAARW
ncbi:MAG TPA: hypothetical protein VFI96_01930, partial [Longimicrobiaceae bacterium]|nr:hypothetical protein [Longimicrobiaceae bacterium]